MASEDRNLHVFFLPFIVTSHIVPLVDIARLFASRGIHVTIATTPQNVSIFKSTVDADVALGRKVAVVTLQFPAAEVGVPEGIENFSTAQSIEQSFQLFKGIDMMQKKMEQLIRDSKPDCIVSDLFFPWTADLAKEMKIPRLVMYANNCFYLCIIHSLKLYAPHKKVNSDEETFVIPHLPDDIEMTNGELEGFLKGQGSVDGWMDSIRVSDLQNSYGIIFTSFSDLEPAYVDHFRNVLGGKCWHIGLPSFFIQENLEKEKIVVTEENCCLNWLDTQKPASVIYVCFGSMIRLSDTQSSEIALALEGSGTPFVWVVKNRDEKIQNWLPMGFEERAKENNSGLIIREWAPQVSILSHVAIGGFLTHCGWNSVLEGVTAGVPFIAWPLFAEQFYNEKLVTKVLNIGVKIGSSVWNEGFYINSPVVGRDEIMEGIDRLMGGSVEALGFQQRAKELSEVAKRSVTKGGASYSDFDTLINEIKTCAFRKINDYVA